MKVTIAIRIETQGGRVVSSVTRHIDASKSMTKMQARAFIDAIAMSGDIDNDEWDQIITTPPPKEEPTDG